MKRKVSKKLTALLLTLCMLLAIAPASLAEGCAAEVTGVTIESGIITAANVTVNGTGKTYTLYAAVYENNALKDIESAEVSATGTVNLTDGISFDASTQTLKCFVWDNNEPVSEVYTYDDTGSGGGEDEDTRYTVTFNTDSHVSVTVSQTQDFSDSSILTENAAAAYARDSATGAIATEPEVGQVNFKVVLEEGYVIDTITATPASNYKNLKNDPDATAASDTYRLTKIKGDITVEISTKLSDGSEETPIAGSGTIVLNSTAIDISAVSESAAELDETGTAVTILLPGTYTVEGTLSDGQINVALPSEDKEVTLNLSGISLTSSTANAINATVGKVTLDTNNSESTVKTIAADALAVYSVNDLTIKGGGTLTAESENGNGIRSKADLKIAKCNLNVTAAKHGIKGDKSVTVTDNNLSVTVNSGGDGITSDNAPTIKKPSRTGTVTIAGGTINIITSTFTNSTGEVKNGDGIQADTLLTVTGGDITVNAAGEAIKANFSHLDLAAETDYATYEDTLAAGDGCIEITGGKFDLTSGEDGIKATKDVSISGGEVTITQAGDEGIQAGDVVIDAETSTPSFTDLTGNVTISGGTVNITSASDGISVVGTYKQTGNPVITIAAGSSSSADSCDGIQAGKAYTYYEIYGSGDNETNIHETLGVIDIEDGTLTVTACGGAYDEPKEKDRASGEEGNATKKDFSCKGIKARSLIDVSGGTINVDSYDDAFHSAHTMNVSGGDITANSCDDGVHADFFLNVTDGSINVTKGYEGLEAAEIDIQGGSITTDVYDDGFNASGKSSEISGKTAYTLSNISSDISTSSISQNSNSDIQLMAGGMGGNPGGMGGDPPGGNGHDNDPTSGSSDYGKLYIKGGNIYVKTQYGDGIDSNGSLIVSGGVSVVEASMLGGSDSDGLDAESISITNGYVIAMSMGGMEDAGTFTQKSVTYGTWGRSSSSSSSGPGAGNYVITDSNGNILCAFKRTSGTIARVLFSSPKLSSGTYYLKSMNGSAELTNGLYGTVDSNYAFTAASGVSAGSTSYTLTTH